jgi:acetyl esterase/lipase
MRRARRLVGVGVVGVVVAAVGSIGSVPPLPAEAGGAQSVPPTITLEPATDLVDAQSVSVTGSGFPAQASVLLLECPTGAAASADCDPASHWTWSEDGSIEVTISMRAILRQPDSQVDCRVADACVLTAYVWDESVGDLQEVSHVPLHFDPAGPLQPPPMVSVAPDQGLVDGQTVTVTGTGFVWQEWVQVVQCAAGLTDWSQCDWETWGFASTPGGSFQTDVPVFAVISVDGGTIDCRSPGQCVLAMVTEGESARDAVTVPLAFDPEAPVQPGPTITVSPDVDLVDGDTVRVGGRGFLRSSERWVQIFQCAPTDADPDRACHPSSDDFLPVDADGTFTVDQSVYARIPLDDGLYDCRTSVEPCSIVATPWLGSARAARADLRFDPDGPVLPDPLIEVTPATELSDFNTVAVSGTNFSPGSRVSVQVCSAETPSNCDAVNGEAPTADAEGRIDTEISVWASLSGEPAVDCRQPPGCVVVARDVRGSSASVPLSFGPPDTPRGRYLDPQFDDVDVVHDIVYRETVDYRGNPVELALDIYRPAGDTATERPAILWLYGGWFAFGDKSDGYIVEYAKESARRGYVGVALNYRVRPDMNTGDLAQLYLAMLDAYDDALAGVAWLQSHAEDYGIDPDAIAASGWSAGAVTSLNLAYLPGQVGPATSPVAAAMPVAGVHVGRVDPGEPPSIIYYATHDTTLPPGTNNTTAVCPQAEQVGVACELVTYDGANHSIIGRSADIMRRSTDFLVEQVLEPRGYFDVSADAGGPYEVDEGASVALDGSGSSGDELVFAWSPGDRVDAPSSASPLLVGVDDGTETLGLTVTNSHGIAAGDSTQVTTRNLAPTITSATTDGQLTSRTVALAATVTDPGLRDTHTATVDWGDGVIEAATVEPSGAGDGGSSLYVAHDYVAGGDYEISLTVTDDDGDSDTWTGGVTVGCTTVGTDRSDVLIGGRGHDVICGLDGNDIVLGLQGDDILVGGPGGDILIGGPGWDIAYGGGGRDLCTVETRRTC